MQRYFLVLYLLIGTVNILAMQVCKRQFYRENSGKWVLLDKGLKIIAPSHSMVSTFSLKIENKNNLDKTKTYVMIAQYSVSYPIKMSSLNTLKSLVEKNPDLLEYTIEFFKNDKILAHSSQVPIKDLLSFHSQLLEQLDKKKEQIEEKENEELQHEEQREFMIHKQKNAIYGLSFLSFILLSYILSFSIAW